MQANTLPPASERVRVGVAQLAVYLSPNTIPVRIVRAGRARNRDALADWLHRAREIPRWLTIPVQREPTFIHDRLVALLDTPSSDLTTADQLAGRPPRD